MNQTIAILDFGSQYSQLIARRVRENRVYSIVCRPSILPEKLREMNVIGLIFSGGPASVYERDAPQVNKALLGIEESLARIQKLRLESERLRLRLFRLEMDLGGLH